MAERRNVRNMPYRHRQDGLTPLERVEEYRLWQIVLNLLTVYVVYPVGAVKDAILALAVIVLMRAQSLRHLIAGSLNHIDKNLSNRGIDTFSDEFLYRHMRFRRSHLIILLAKLNVPNVIIVSNGITCSGEYALLLMLYRLHYPCTLASMEPIFGRDYSQISRIFNWAIDFVYENHKDKVLGNIDWYADRFDSYNNAYKEKIAGVANNPQPGTVPVQLNNLFASLDCTAEAICRPYQHDNAQFAFFNQYHHGHFIIWQGVTFPDGMIVLEGPEPGYFTDIMVWRDCQLRLQLELIMAEREANGLPRLKLYADKVYNSSQLVTAAWSLRHGAVADWMTLQNSMMSKIRVSVEWAFDRIISSSKYAAFWQGLMVQNSPVAKYYTVAVLLANCNTCLCGDIDTLYFDCLPPTLDDYFDQ